MDVAIKLKIIKKQKSSLLEYFFRLFVCFFGRSWGLPRLVAEKRILRSFLYLLDYVSLNKIEKQFKGIKKIIKKILQNHQEDF